MAQLGTTNIRMSDIRNLKSSGDNPSSLSEREQLYMGTSGTWNRANTRVCMPNDVVEANPVRLARAIDGSWTYVGPAGYTGPTWGPHNMSEFREAYNTPPRVRLSLERNGTGGRCRIRITPSLGVPPYYYNLTGTWQGPVTSEVVLGNEPAGTYTVRIRDSLNCGANGTIAATAVYPGEGESLLNTNPW
jgi:hypothetical protein